MFRYIDRWVVVSMECRMAKPLVIDFHAHMLEKDVLAQAQGKTVLTGFGTRQPPIVDGPKRTAMFEKMLDPKVQIADMDHRGVDVHVISSSTVIQGTSWADATTELDLVRRVPEALRRQLRPATAGRGPFAARNGARHARAEAQRREPVGKLPRPLPRPRALSSVLGGGDARRGDGLHPSGRREGSLVPGFRPVELGRPADRGGQGDVVDHLR